MTRFRFHRHPSLYASHYTFTRFWANASTPERREPRHRGIDRTTGLPDAIRRARVEPRLSWWSIQTVNLTDDYEPSLIAGHRTYSYTSTSTSTSTNPGPGTRTSSPRVRNGTGEYRAIAAPVASGSAKPICAELIRPYRHSFQLLRPFRKFS